MSNELPFRSQAGSSASMPEPAGGVIPPFSGAHSGSIPAGGEWAPDADGMPRSSNAGGVTFSPGFNADADTGSPEQFFEQKAPPSGNGG